MSPDSAESQTEDLQPEEEEQTQKFVDVRLTVAEANLLHEVLPELIVKEKRHRARQMLNYSGRPHRLESVREKIDDAEPYEVTVDE